MIHIIHTPAAVLIRQRQAVLLRSFCMVLVPGLAGMLWAFTTPLLIPKGLADCNFTGVPYEAAGEAPRKQEGLSIPRLPHTGEVWVKPTLLPCPQAELEFEFPEAPELQAEVLDTPTLEAELCLQGSQEDHPHRQQQHEEHPRAQASSGSQESHDTAPSYLQCPQPPYPDMHRRRRTQGMVSIKILVGADGKPKEAHTTGSSGSPALDRHTCNWVLRHWKFNPARKAGAYCSAWVSTKIIYSLEN